MSKKTRRRRQVEEAERPAANRILAGRFKYLLPIILGIIGASIGWFIGPTQAIALGGFCIVLGFTVGLLLDTTTQNRNINRRAMRFQEYWHGEAKHGGSEAPD